MAGPPACPEPRIAAAAAAATNTPGRPADTLPMSRHAWSAWSAWPALAALLSRWCHHSGRGAPHSCLASFSEAKNNVSRPHCHTPSWVDAAHTSSSGLGYLCAVFCWLTSLNPVNRRTFLVFQFRDHLSLASEGSEVCLLEGGRGG